MTKCSSTSLDYFDGFFAVERSSYDIFDKRWHIMNRFVPAKVAENSLKEKKTWVHGVLQPERSDSGLNSFGQITKEQFRKIFSCR